MKIAIKNPAPAKRVQRYWGDFHFGNALQRAFEAQGVEVVQHLWPNWDETEGEDVVLVLRGVRRWDPPPGPISILWAMSHPATVTIDEIDKYTFAYVASETHRRELEPRSRRPIELLRQCSEIKPAGSFRPTESFSRNGICFVGNARGGIYRDSVYWTLSAGLEPEIIGREWHKTPAKKYVKSQYLNNAELSTVYEKSRFGINDHWSDMKYYGYINNRIFDCIFSGLPIITDEFPEIRNVFKDTLLYAHDIESFRRAAEDVSARYDEHLERTYQASLELYESYSFDSRAAKIISDSNRIPKKKNAVFNRSSRLLIKPVERLRKISENRDFSSILGYLGEILERDSDTSLNVLHINPSDSGRRIFHTIPEFAYMTAGFGYGPWEVDLSEHLHQIAYQTFDVIFVERLRQDYRSPKMPSSALPALTHRLNRKGIVLVPKRTKSHFKSDVDLKIIDRGGGYLSVRRVH